MIQGFSFSPLRLQLDSLKQVNPTAEEIDADLALLACKTNAVRTCTLRCSCRVTGTGTQARTQGGPGTWEDGYREKSRQEVEQRVQVADKNRRNVVGVVVGNEALLRVIDTGS